MRNPVAVSYPNRRCFVGGSDARIIMGGDEAALVRLWREKRGEAEPEDLSGNLTVQLGRRRKSSTEVGMSATPASGFGTCSAGLDTRQYLGWRPLLTGLSMARKPYSKPSSCCPGPSRKRW